ncbi:hypothetical protein KM043_001742 [Ampulex compressa]|nr:hypothetical protein KM043_001742 [Ampulex compressa]
MLADDATRTYGTAHNGPYVGRGVGATSSAASPDISWLLPSLQNTRDARRTVSPTLASPRLPSPPLSLPRQPSPPLAAPRSPSPTLTAPPLSRPAPSGSPDFKFTNDLPAAGGNEPAPRMAPFGQLGTLRFPGRAPPLRDFLSGGQTKGRQRTNDGAAFFLANRESSAPLQPPGEGSGRGGCGLAARIGGKKKRGLAEWLAPEEERGGRGTVSWPGSAGPGEEERR